MKLIKRFRYANEYDLGKNKRRSVLGGIPNVPYNKHGDLKPLNNEVRIINNNPFAKYVLRQGPFIVGFHSKINNKYGVIIKLRTGESLIKTAIGDIACTPTIIDKRVLQWEYPNGSWIREYATEKEVKEAIKQKAGQEIKFKYKLDGLYVKKQGTKFNIHLLRNNKKAFHIERPYYCKANGEIISYVPIIWQKVGDDWVITYPAPATDKYIDPVIVFGEGVGQIGGDHKDTFVHSGAIDRSFATDTFFWIRNPDLITIMRFSLDGHIPINAIVNTAILSITTNAFHVPRNIECRSLLIAWGVTPTVEGITENPATGGQATWRRSFDFNGGGGDVAWTGGNFSAADYGVIEDIQPLAAAGVRTVWNIPIMSQAWVLNDIMNYGLCLRSPVVAGNNTLWSQNDVNVARRPFLEIDWDLPSEPSGVNPCVQLNRLKTMKRKTYLKKFA